MEGDDGEKVSGLRGMEAGRTEVSFRTPGIRRVSAAAPATAEGRRLEPLCSGLVAMDEGR